MKKQFDFKIGADPEFILTIQDKKVNAKETMKLLLHDKPKLIEGPEGFSIEGAGEIGWDGAESTAEIRPNPEYSPQKITNNFTTILKTFFKNIKLCDLSTVSEFSSIGGHIHLEIPPIERMWSTEKIRTIQKRLTAFYLPILVSENKTNLNLRLKQNYGSYKDYKVEKRFTHPNGTPGFTFEFRTPSAEWLTTPKLTNATLAYMGVIYHEIINNPRNFNKFNDITYKSDKQGDALQTLTIMEFELLTKAMLSKIKKYIKTFEMYPNFKEEIDYIFKINQVIKDKKKADYNIALGWKLIEKKIPNKKDILMSNKKLQKIAKKEDFDELKEVLGITYNNDTNVAIFTEELKDRVAIFNWKLKNKYFIFGIRKGINKIITKNLKGDYITGEEVIKTKSDKQAVNNLFQKMENKFNLSNSYYLKTIDFTTGKIKNINESIILIGLPYQMRVEKKTKDFLNFIWLLEQNKLPKIKKKTLIDDYGLNYDLKGKIYQILNKQSEAENIIIDNNSISLNNQTNVINQLVEEGEDNINN